MGQFLEKLSVEFLLFIFCFEVFDDGSAESNTEASTVDLHQHVQKLNYSLFIFLPTFDQLFFERV